MTHFTGRAALLLWFSVIIVGCTTMSEKSALADKPVTKAPGSVGEIFLSLDGNQWQDPQETRPARYTSRARPFPVRQMKKVTPQQMTLVKVKNDSGKTLGRYMLPVYSGEIIFDSLFQGLSAAGYTVRVVKQLPKNATIVVDISSITADLEETSGLLTLEAKCDLHVKLDVWRNGVKVNSHDYTSFLFDYSFANKQLLLPDLLMRSAQDVMMQAVRDIGKDYSVL